MQFAINATAILNDRDDPRLLEDMTKVYTENNEDWSPTEDLILPPVTLPGATSRRVRRFATATHQNPVHLQLIQDTKAKLSMGQYHDLSNEYLDSLIIALEEIQDYNNDVDVEFSVSLSSAFTFFYTSFHYTLSPRKKETGGIARKRRQKKYNEIYSLIHPL